MKKMTNNEFLEFFKQQVDFLRAYISAKTEEEKIKIRTERDKITEEILNIKG